MQTATNDSQRRSMIAAAASPSRTKLPQVTGLLEILDGRFFALRVRCDDEHEYAIKGIPSRQCRRARRRSYGRTLFVEQAVARLGQALVTPIPDVSLVELTSEFIQCGTWTRCLEPGICHSLDWIDHVRDTQSIDEILTANSDGQNRERVAALAVLIGWFSNTPGDTQFLLESQPPYRVFSVDHGLLADGIPIWESVRKLDVWQGRGVRPHHAMTRHLKQWCNQQPHEIPEIRAVAERLAQVTDWQIAQSLAHQPNAWGVGMCQRAQMMKYLQQRRDEMVRVCSNGMWSN